MLAALASPPATKALDPDPFPRHSLRHAVYAAQLHFGFETATAFPERLLTGERLEPAFLITKPFHPATVAAVMSQALFFECNATRVDSSRGTMRQSKLQPSLFLEVLTPQLSSAVRSTRV